jgi:hypothetical protein
MFAILHDSVCKHCNMRSSYCWLVVSTAGEIGVNRQGRCSCSSTPFAPDPVLAVVDGPGSVEEPTGADLGGLKVALPLVT